MLSNYETDLFTMENGCKVNAMVEEHLPGKTEVIMKDNGATIFHGVKESSYIMKMSTIRVNLFATADKAMENMSILV